jgi:hypothetical protein
MQLGVSGHQQLGKRLSRQGVHRSEAAAWRWAEVAFRELLDDLGGGPVTVVSSLAAGTDQRFARVALAQGARLAVILPSARYEETFSNAEERTEYAELLAAAEAVETLAFATPSEAAFFAAGKRVVEQSDELVVVWDGDLAQGLGGTGDIVSYAQGLGRRVVQLDPIHLAIIRRGGK